MIRKKFKETKLYTLNAAKLTAKGIPSAKQIIFRRV
jgi:hypothetical protein